MSYDMNFFMKDNITEEVQEIEIEGISKFRYPSGEKEGDIIPWVIKGISSEARDNITDMCTKTIGKGKKRREKIDKAKFSRLLVVEACVYPNFTDKGFLQSFDCVSSEMLVTKVLDKPGDFDRIVQDILSFCGYDDDNEEMLKEAKN